jgi:hypothetical protein
MGLIMGLLDAASGLEAMELAKSSVTMGFLGRCCPYNCSAINRGMIMIKNTTV